MDKIKVSRAVIVEGRYDKIKLSSLIDGIIIQTDGFRIYKDKEKAARLQDQAEENAKERYDYLQKLQVLYGDN